jgi:hypothetical protein
MPVIDTLVTLAVGAFLGFGIGRALVPARIIEMSPRAMLDRLIDMRATRLNEKAARTNVNREINAIVEKITGEKCNDF